MSNATEINLDASGPEVIATESAKPDYPNCECLPAIDRFLAPLNGKVGVAGFGRKSVPIVYVRRIEVMSERPPTLLARFCPFCGVPYGPASRRAAPAEPVDHAPSARDGLDAFQSAVFTLLRAKPRTEEQALALIAQASSTAAD